MPRAFSRFRWLRCLLLAGLGLLGSACREADGIAEAQAATPPTVLDQRLGSRSYRLVIPAGEAGGPRPLILALHGGWGLGRQLQAISGLDLPATAAGFLVAYPDGVLRSWNAGGCCRPATSTGVDDVAFLKALVDDIARRVPIDRQRVYGTGFSNGAMMLYRLVCEAPGLLAAIAPVAGGPAQTDCRQPRPVSALLIRSRDDPRIPWDGGEIEGGFQPALHSVVAQLGQRAGCGRQARTFYQGGGASCASLGGCSEGLELSWCGLDGVGHQWPGGGSLLPAVLGRNSEQIPGRFRASEQIVRFFERHGEAQSRPLRALTTTFSGENP